MFTFYLNLEGKNNIHLHKTDTIHKSKAKIIRQTNKVEGQNCCKSLPKTFPNTYN